MLGKVRIENGAIIYASLTGNTCEVGRSCISIKKGGGGECVCLPNILMDRASLEGCYLKDCGQSKG